MGHWMDIGGALGRTQDIFSEGLQLPIVKIFKRGVQDDELTRIIRTNVRIPELAMGDFRAQVASIRTGERRYTALVRKYGIEAVDTCVRDIYAMSERKARLAVASMPDGVYEAESFMDDDGVGDKTIPIKVRVTISGEQMTIDLTDVGAQVPGYFNSGDTAGRSAAQVAFKCLTTPTLYPINDGSFSPLKIVLPPGRVISAVKPSAMRMWMTIPMTVVDTVFRAMAQCVPDRTIAAHHADLCSATFYGLNPKTGRFFTRGAGVLGGGFGAKYDSDGMSGTVCQNDGDTHNSPVEATESKIPVLIEKLRAAAGLRRRRTVSRRARDRTPRARDRTADREHQRRTYAVRAVGLARWPGCIADSNAGRTRRRQHRESAAREIPLRSSRGQRKHDDYAERRRRWFRRSRGTAARSGATRCCLRLRYAGSGKARLRYSE